MPAVTLPECGLKSNEWLNEIESFSEVGLPKHKEDEMKRLLASVRRKHEKFNVLQQYHSEAEISANMIRKDLMEKYALNTDGCNYNPQADVLFGLGNLNIEDNQASPEQLAGLQEQNVSYNVLPNLLFAGSNTEGHFPPNILTKRIDYVKAMLSVHREQRLTQAALEDCIKNILELRDLLLIKREIAQKLAEAYLRGLHSIDLEAQLVKFQVLKDYFSEDKNVVVASFKLRDYMAMKCENLRLRQKELQKKIQDFKRLEGFSFDQILKDYRTVCDSISSKEWVLHNIYNPA